MTRIYALTLAVVTATFVLSPFVISPFSGFTVDQLPVPQVDPPSQPAGWAFGIWGLIYTWLVVSAVFGLFYRHDDAGWNVARPWLIGSLLIGTPWLAVANASAEWATVLIWAMLGLAVMAVLRAPRTDRWWFQAPVALYAGWLTAACQVSLASLGAGYGIIFGGFGWAIISVAIALVIALSVMTRKRGIPEYAGAVIWALVGIIAANWTATPAIAWLAMGGVLVLLVGASATRHRT